MGSGANSGPNTDSDPRRMRRIRSCDCRVHLMISLKYDERETRPYRICHDVSRFGNPTQQNPVEWKAGLFSTGTLTCGCHFNSYSRTSQSMEDREVRIRLRRKKNA